MTTAATHAMNAIVPAKESPKAAPALTASELGKCFRLYPKPGLRLLEWCTLNRAKHHTNFWALKGIDLTIAPGECFGIIGQNGSGKSTLVKLLAGTLYPTAGSCSVRGAALSLMELGTGLHRELTGRENVENLSRLLGLGIDHTREHMDEIEAFAELGAFFDRPVGVYSAGMRLRLTFSTFAAFQPDVLLIDEALSVGDVFFQQRCAARIRELLCTGMTLVLVSHDMAAVQNLCDRVLLLRDGKPAFVGEPEEAVSRYLSRAEGSSSSSATRAQSADNCSKGAADSVAMPGGSLGTAIDGVLEHDIIGDRADARHGHGELRILAARVTDSIAKDTLSFEMGNEAVVTLVVEASESSAQRIANPRAGIRLFDRLGNHVFGAGTAIVGEPLPSLSAGERVVIRFAITLDLKPGRYTLGMAASTPADDDDPNTAAFQDSIDMLGPIQVRPPEDSVLPFFGLAKLPLTISHEVVRDG